MTPESPIEGRSNESAANTDAINAAGENVRLPEEGSVPIPDTLPILPTGNIVLFPGSVLPLTISQPAARRLIEDSLPHSKIIGTCAQRETSSGLQDPDSLYKVGVAAGVLKVIRQPEDSLVVVISVLERIAIRRIVSTEPFIRAEIEVLRSSPPPRDDKAFEATVQQLRESAIRLVELAPEVPEEAVTLLRNLTDPGRLADFLASNLNLDPAQKQEILQELDIPARVRVVLDRVAAQTEIAQIQQKIRKDVAAKFSDAERRAFLREQIKAIQKELGEGEQGTEEEVADLRRRLEEAKPPPEVLEQADRELRRLGHLHPASPEFSVIVSYVETLSELPWSKSTDDNLDLDRAQAILDRDHFDLEKVKRRLLEYLAVRKLNPTGHGPILCFLGPPGVGKTSLGQSIADALGRKFSRLSLGGVQDEADIRGHRRTYIGSMPGRIIQELRRTGSNNPVMMLDEIDKLGYNFRGDPASALLEVLDPRQNHAFVDHYLDVPFDLSQVMFIATANYLDPVPPALRDRLEIISLAGYTDVEKLEIAKRYLVPRQLKENGLTPEQAQWDPKAIQRVIDDYTREAGVRELERQIGAVCRAIAARVARGEIQGEKVTPELIQKVLGPPKYIRETRLHTSKPGVVTGLAWTPTGGEILHIEALKFPGKGNVLLTGQIGDVMKESAQAALSLVKSRCQELGLNCDELRESDIHIHVPAGAVPKDGPSAGVGMFTAIASLFRDRPVPAEIAMTGEITLRGLVLPIGGLKEKALAAQRAGAHTVIIPRLNEKDLPEIPEDTREKLKFVLVDNVDELLKAALGEPKDAAPAGGTS